jgi:small subunit ribosomal protein S8e
VSCLRSRSLPLGISRDSRHKRRATGGRRAIHQKKRKAELGRPAANTKLVGDKKQAAVHLVRGFGGNIKYRAIRVESGNFGWASETFTQKARILDTVYNASNNELVRTKTLVKGAIVSVRFLPRAPLSISCLSTPVCEFRFPVCHARALLLDVMVLGRE